MTEEEQQRLLNELNTRRSMDTVSNIQNVANLIIVLCIMFFCCLALVIFI